MRSAPIFMSLLRLSSLSILAAFGMACSGSSEGIDDVSATNASETAAASSDSKTADGGATAGETIRAAVEADVTGSGHVSVITRCVSHDVRPLQVIVYADNSVSITWLGGTENAQSQGGRFAPGKYEPIISSAGDDFQLTFKVGGKPAILSAYQEAASTLQVAGSSIGVTCELL